MAMTPEEIVKGLRARIWVVDGANARLDKDAADMIEQLQRRVDGGFAMIELDDEQRAHLAKMSVEEIHPTFVALLHKWQRQILDAGIIPPPAVGPLVINQFIGFGMSCYIRHSADSTREGAIQYLTALYDEVNAVMKKNRVMQ